MKLLALTPLALHHKLIILSLMIYFENRISIQFILPACGLVIFAQCYIMKLNTTWTNSHCYKWFTVCVPYDMYMHTSCLHTLVQNSLCACILKLCIQKLRTIHQFQLQSHNTTIKKPSWRLDEPLLPHVCITTLNHPTKLYILKGDVLACGILMGDFFLLDHWTSGIYYREAVVLLLFWAV